MDQCICCNRSRPIEKILGLPWCAECIAEDCPDEYAAGFSPDFTAAIKAEIRRRVPTPRDDNRFKPAEQRNDEKV